MSDLNDARLEEEVVEDNGFADPAQTDIDVVEAAAEEAPKELTEDEKLDKLEAAALRQSLHREIHFRTLQFCLERKELREVEDMIAACPQFAKATLSQYHLIKVLVKAGGLNELMMDENDNVVTEQQLVGLTEDEADDLVAYFCYETTEVGAKFVEMNTPKTRMEELFALEPHRVETYRELLAYCNDTPRTYNEISELLDGREVLYRQFSDGSREKMQPSVFVDKLERAGGLFYRKGWLTSDEGKEFIN